MILRCGRANTEPAADGVTVALSVSVVPAATGEAGDTSSATVERLLAFLDDAYRLGLLRIAGPAYQFHHAKFQDHLAAG